MPKLWWSFIIRGSFAMIIFLGLLIWPEETEKRVVFYLGTFFLMNGLLSLNTARNLIKNRAAILAALLGIFGGLGLMVGDYLIHTGYRNVLIAMTVILIGILQIRGEIQITADSVHKLTSSNIILGGLEILLGLVILVLPEVEWEARIVAMLWMFAVMIILFWQAFRLRRLWIAIQKQKHSM